MNKGPIGVWFSAALAILVLGVWLGFKLGPKVAYHQYLQQQQKQGTSRGPEFRNVESVFWELTAIQVLRLYTAAQNEAGTGKNFLLAEIEGLKDVRRRSDVQEITPVVNLNLGLAYVDAAMAEERKNNKELAAKYMKSAQEIFLSLGWQDCSPETLRLVATRELDKWRVPPQTKEHGK